jgi:hypothetical protein
LGKILIQLEKNYFEMATFEAYHAFGGNHGGNMTVVDKVLPEMLHLIDPHWYQVNNFYFKFVSNYRLPANISCS